MRATDPIGIFDSGIGGLTVARAVRDLVPNEDIIYFGDTAHLPYGDRSPALIQQYTEGITEFLLEKGCKAIVIACNSASANAQSTVEETAKGKAIVLDVISPLVQYVSERFSDKVVGVIGTKATINSNSYPKAFSAAGAKNKIKTLATPLLAPLIEEGFVQDDISAAVLKRYLDRKELNGIELLILGCTHYPILSDEIAHYYAAKKVEVVDPPKVIAEQLRQALQQAQMLSGSKGGKQHFYVSDLTEAFAKSTRLFFGEDAILEEVRLWDHSVH